MPACCISARSASHRDSGHCSGYQAVPSNNAGVRGAVVCALTREPAARTMHVTAMNMREPQRNSARLIRIIRANPWLVLVFLSSSPNFADNALEIRTQHLLNHRRRLSALLQLRRDDFHVVWAVQIGYIGIPVFARRSNSQLFSSRDVFVKLLLLLRSKRNRLNRSIRPNPYMVCTASFERTQDMIDHMLPRRDSRRRHQV